MPMRPTRRTRDRLEAEARAIVDDQASPAGGGGGSLTDAVSGSSPRASRSSPSWPASAAAARWIRPDWPTCTATRRRCSIGCCCASSTHRTSASRALIDAASTSLLPALTVRSSRSSSALALFDQWRERRGGFQLIWAIGMLFYGIAAGCEALAGARRLERGPVPDLVPDRRRLDRRLARPRDRVPAGSDPVRLQLRPVPVPGRRCSRSSSGTGPTTPGAGRAAAPVLHRRGRPRPGRGGRDLLPERALADARRRCRGRGDGPAASC